MILSTRFMYEQFFTLQLIIILERLTGLVESISNSIFLRIGQVKISTSTGLLNINLNIKLSV
ncbi:hypothetical protein Misp06_01055 [Microbulbifer sp. NBRC 101763]